MRAPASIAIPRIGAGALRLQARVGMRPAPLPCRRLGPEAALPRSHRLCLLLVFAMLGLLAFRKVGSLDIGFHLKAGEFILEHQAWPRTDPFTDSLRDHPYIDTSWGYQVLVALVHRFGGVPCLQVFHVGLVLATFALLYRTARLRLV